MKDVRSIVMQLSGRWGNKCYIVLCLAVEAALDLPRDDVQLKSVLLAVSKQNGRSPEANSRALARAAHDIWDRGNLELLTQIFGRTPKRAPSSKELLYVLTDYVRPEIHYRCWKSETADAFGIAIEEDGEPRLITEPFSSDEAFVRLLARRLSVQQKPADLFWIQYLSGKIPGVLPPQKGRITREDEDEDEDDKKN